jgi:hypothetical protein
VAALFGFAGVLVVIAPQLTGKGGWYPPLMLRRRRFLPPRF